MIEKPYISLRKINLAKELIDMEEYKQSMQNIYSTSVHGYTVIRDED